MPYFFKISLGFIPYYYILIVSVVLNFTHLNAQISDTVSINTAIDSVKALFMKNPKAATKIANMIINTSQEIGYHSGIVEGNTILSNIKYYEGDIASALDIYTQLIALDKTKDSTFLPSLYHKRAITLFELKRHYDAIEDAYAAFSFMKTPKTDIYNIRCNILLSDIYDELGHFDNAIKYSRAAYDISIIQNDSVHMSYTSGILGDKFLLKEELDSTYKYLKISKQTHKPSYKSTIIIETNYNYYMSKYHLANNDLDEALYHAKETERLARYNSHLVNLSHNVSGKIYFRLKKYKKAIFHFERIISAISQKKDYHTLAEANYFLAQVYFLQGHMRKAYQFLNTSNTLKDSLQQRDNKMRIAYLSSKYESEKKDKAIRTQQLKLQQQETLLLKKQRQSILYFITIATVLIILFFVIVFYRNKQRLKQSEIENLIMKGEITKRDALMEGEERERLRIAQDMHDGINGDLVAMKYQMMTLIDGNTNTQADNKVSTIIHSLDKSIQQVRNISNNLVPPSLLYANLEDSLRAYCIKMSNSTSIQIQFFFYGTLPMLHKGVQMSIYRIVQELINNIIKHALASNAIVQLNADDYSLLITVEDDGIGFDVNKLHKGLGLKNIKSRIKFLNAKLEITSDERGTTFNMEFDLYELNAIGEEFKKAE